MLNPKLRSVFQSEEGSLLKMTKINIFRNFPDCLKGPLKFFTPEINRFEVALKNKMVSPRVK